MQRTTRTRHLLVITLLVGIGTLNVAALSRSAYATRQAAVTLPPCPPPPATPGVPPPSVPCEEPPEDEGGTVGAEDVCFTLEADPSDIVAPASIITYTLIMCNFGAHRVKNVRITFPFQPEIEDVVDATFTDSKAWVSEVQPDALQIRMEALGVDQTITSTLRLYVSPNVEPGTVLQARAQARWGNGDADWPVLSNRVELRVEQSADVVPEAPPEAGPDPSEPPADEGDEETDPSSDEIPDDMPDAPGNTTAGGIEATLDVAPSGDDTRPSFTLVYDGFASSEPVSLWYHHPDGSVRPLGEVQADNLGVMQYVFAADELPSGEYMAVAYGQCSEVTAVGRFTK